MEARFKETKVLKVLKIDTFVYVLRYTLNKSGYKIGEYVSSKQKDKVLLRKTKTHIRCSLKKISF